MRLRSLSIVNFKAIARFDVRDLKDLVVIAGPNGSGKTCILDAIRLLKSAYGGYQPNEVHQWFGEFQINMQQSSALAPLFRDPSRPIEISADIEFSEEERAYVRENAERLVQPIVWRRIIGPGYDGLRLQQVALSNLYREHGERAKVETDLDASKIRTEISKDSHRLHLTFPPEGLMVVSPDFAADVLFQTYLPAHLGIIDFHGANRTYAREGSDVTVTLADTSDQRRDQSLYNV